jgi:signal transduction histidine kinase
MLHEFLVENRAKILAGSEKGLPQFFDHLTQELERASKRKPIGDGLECPDPSTRHGQEMKRHGYSVSQVVDGYGALSRSINALAQTESTPISAIEFETFNIVLDKAIAEAVSGFSRRRSETTDCAQKMGVLAHELRNALAAATIAHAMLETGLVGVSGKTNMILGKNLDRMREILDRSFSEVRMENEKDSRLSPTALLDVAEEVEATAGYEARTKGLILAVTVDPELYVSADPHYLISALSNLVQNAIKYSTHGGAIQVRSVDQGLNACLEVEDRCGGLPAGKAEELFQPFTQRSADRTGLGLGLSISRKAVAMSGGTLAVRDLPGKGCIFTITLPKAKVP